jgi:glycosyltransferase involved in cell wall biosynthesis
MFLDTDFPPDSRVENEATSLLQAGHDVYLYSLSYKSDQYEREVINGIEVHRYPAGNLVYKLSALAYTVPLFHRLIASGIRQFIGEVKPDVLHIHDMPLARVVINLNRRFKKTIVLDLHEDRPEIMRYYGHVQRGLGRYLISVKKWRQVQLDLMRASDHLILVTEEAKAKYVDLGVVNDAKVTVVPNTIRPDIFLSYPDDLRVQENLEGNLIILYLGDTGLRRGTDTAVKAMPLILSQEPHVRLVLVGKNKEDGQLKALAETLGVAKQVLFEGWQDVVKFPAYIKASDICISPLKRNPHHDTTFANKLFQYMALGKPVLVSDCPAQLRVVEDCSCGLIHEADNPESFAEKALLLLKDPQLRQKMGENALKSVQSTWNWDITGRGLLKLYERINHERG